MAGIGMTLAGYGAGQQGLQQYLLAQSQQQQQQMAMQQAMQQQQSMKYGPGTLQALLSQGGGQPQPLQNPGMFAPPSPGAAPAAVSPQGAASPAGGAPGGAGPQPPAVPPTAAGGAPSMAGVPGGGQGGVPSMGGENIQAALKYLSDAGVPPEQQMMVLKEAMGMSNPYEKMMMNFMLQSQRLGQGQQRIDQGDDKIDRSRDWRDPNQRFSPKSGKAATGMSTSELIRQEGQLQRLHDSDNASDEEKAAYQQDLADIRTELNKRRKNHGLPAKPSSVSGMSQPEKDATAPAASFEGKPAIDPATQKPLKDGTIADDPDTGAAYIAKGGVWQTYK